MIFVDAQVCAVYDHSMSIGIDVQTIFYREVGPDYAIDDHEHKLYQWYACLQGEVTHNVNGKDYVLKPEQSLLIPPLAKRSPFSSGKAPGYIVALFDSGPLSLDDYPEGVLDTPESLRSDLFALVNELKKPGGGDSVILCHTLLVRLLIGLRRSVRNRHSSSRLSPLNAGVRGAVVEDADAFMQANCHRPLSREDVARSVNYSAPHLARIFKSVTGITPGQRLKDIRMMKAKSLLLDSTMSITRIAGELGLSSFSHFSHVFREETGMTPGEYRRSGGRIYQGE